MLRFLQPTGPTGGLLYDPENSRLRSKIKKAGFDPTQENLAKLLEIECTSAPNNLVDSLRVTRGLHIPIMLDHTLKTTKEGNRRLWSYRQLRNESTDFDYIPCEAPAEPVTEKEMRTILACRHVIRPKDHASREQGREISAMLQDWTLEEVSRMVGRDPEMIRAYVAASEDYDKFDAYMEAHPKKGDQKARDRDWFTYLLKINQKAKFVREHWHNGDQEKLFDMFLNGQFNDCLNIDQIGKVWDNPESRKALEEGMQFKECIRAYNQDCSVRRGSELFKDMKRITNSLKTMSVVEKKRIATEAGSADLLRLDKLEAALHSVLTDIRGYKIPTLPKPR